MRKQEFDEMLQALHARATKGPGVLGNAQRQAIAKGSDVEPALATYVEKVHKHAYKVVQEDFEGMKSAGYSEDAIFEATISAAVGAALWRWEIAKSAMNEVEGSQ